MNCEPLLGPLAKAERAKAQIQDLNIAIRSFFESTPYKIISYLDLDSEEEVWRFHLTKKLPADLSIRVGEIIHNLRSALDNMLAEIVIASGRTDTKVEFPFGKDLSEFETALSKQKKLPADAIPLLRSLCPFKDGGNCLLWLLHSVNRRDKHRMGLVPINLRTEGDVSYLSVWFGQALVIGSRSGHHLAVERRSIDATEFIKRSAVGRVWGCYGISQMDPISGLPMAPQTGMKISFPKLGASADDSMEFLTTTPGAKFKTDFKPSFDVAFKDVGAFEGEPIVHVLHQARDLVERILLTFRRRFFA